jgi:WD40 repeat protein
VKPEALFTILLVAAGCSSFAPAESPLHRFENAHFPASTAVAFDPGSTLLASGGLAGDIALWTISQPTELARIAAHKKAVRGLSFIHTDALLSAGEDGKLAVWRAPWNAPAAAVQSSSISSMSVGSEHVVTGHKDGWIRVWTLPTLELVRSRKLTGAIQSLALYESSIAVGTTAGYITLYDLQLELVRELERTPWAPRDLRFSPDGKWIAAGVWFRIQLWDAATGRRESISTEHHGLVISLDFSPTGRELASLGHHTDSAIRIIEPGTWSLSRRLESHRLCGEMVRFSPNGRYLASASDDESVRLYTVQRTEDRGQRTESTRLRSEDRGLNPED